MPKTALTDAKLRSLKPAPKGKRVQIMDSIARGLGVRVTDTGAKTFIFQGRFPGSTNSVRREITATTLAALIKQGIDPKEIERKAQEERAQARAITFGAVCEDYFRDKLARQRPPLTKITVARMKGSQ